MLGTVMLNIPGSIVKPLKVARDLYPLFLAMSGCTVLPRNLPPPNKTLCNQLAHKSVHHALTMHKYFQVTDNVGIAEYRDFRKLQQRE